MSWYWYVLIAMVIALWLPWRIRLGQRQARYDVALRKRWRRQEALNPPREVIYIHAKNRRRGAHCCHREEYSFWDDILGCDIGMGGLD